MDYQKIKVGQYASEALPDIEEAIRTGGDLLVKAPTGSGKTHLILSMKDRLAHRKSAFLCPVRPLVDNIGKEWPHIPHGYGWEFLNAYKHSPFIVTTYDSLKHFADWKRCPDLIISDEAHLLVGHSEFRGITRDILEYPSQKILMSATPEVIQDWPGLYGINITFEKERKRKRIEIIPTNTNPLQIAIDIIEDEQRDRSRLCFIRINNKDLIDEVHQRLYNKYGDKIAVYYSEGSLMDVPETEYLKRGIIREHIEILLCTSVFDNGLSLDVCRPVDIHAINNKPRQMPNPVEMVQLHHRVRNGSVSMRIYGGFGDRTLPRIEEFTFSTPSASDWLETAVMKYDWYSELNYEGYGTILYRYGYYAIQVREPKFTQKASDVGSRIRKITIAKNLNSFKDLYAEVEHKYSYEYNLEEDWLGYFTGNKVINHNHVPNSAREVQADILKAGQQGIHPSLYINDTRYEQKRLRRLITAVQSHKDDAGFAEIIDALLDNVVIGSFKMPLETYHKLHPNEKKEQIKTVAALMYEGRKWDGKHIKLTPKADAVQVEYCARIFKSSRVGTKLCNSL